MRTDRNGTSSSTSPPTSTTGEKVAGLVGVILDITQRKESERKLSDSEARLKAIWNSLLTGIVVIDEQTHTIVDANPQAVEIVGLPREKIVGHTCRILCPSEVNRCPVTDLGHNIYREERILLGKHKRQVPILKTVTPRRRKRQATVG